MAEKRDLESPDFEGLISAYFDGTIEAAPLAELERRLSADRDFAREFARWSYTHRQITELLAEDGLIELLEAHPAAAPSLPRRMRSDERRRSLAPLIAWASCAAIVGIAIGSLWWDRGSERLVKSAIVDHDSTIATITRLVGPEWKHGASARRLGDPLKAGERVQLSKGCAKITFDCGAEVVLEGPCDFEAKSHMIGKLHAGKLTADVPRRAFAFAILCPGVDLLDLGTSFGVSVDERSQTELHVFDGEVLCNPSDGRADQANLVHVTEDKAMAFSPNGQPGTSIAIDTNQFEPLIAVRKPHQPKGIAADIDSGALALWLAADSGVTADDRGKVSAWGDRLAGKNLAAEDAVQPDPKARPDRVARALNGHPAIRFDGQSDFLVTTPLPTTDDQTVLLVAQFSKAAFRPGRKWGGQMLNYDGPPSRYLSDTLEPGVLQIGEPLLQDQFRPALLTAQVFAGFIGSTTVESGRVDAAPLGPDEPFVLSYRYDYSRGEAELRLNGQSHGVKRAFAPQGTTSHKIIGRHAWMQLFFAGDLAELAIYNGALSDDDLRVNTKRLAEKYGVELQSP